MVWLFSQCKKQDAITYWILYGADLYKYIPCKLFDLETEKLLRKFKILDLYADFKRRDTLTEICRERVIRNLDFIITVTDFDYKLAKEHYLTSAKRRFSIYGISTKNRDKCDNLIIENDFKYNFRKKQKKIILVGHSGSPYNNHLDIIKRIAQIGLEDYLVISPISYGGHKSYVEEYVKRAKSLLGELFIPIYDFLSLEDYIKILKQVDVAIFNSYRQIGGSNIHLLLYLGKKIYGRQENNIIAEWLEKDAKIFNINSLEADGGNLLDELDRESQEANRKLVKRRWGPGSGISNYLKYISE